MPSTPPTPAAMPASTARASSGKDGAATTAGRALCFLCDSGLLSRRDAGSMSALLHSPELSGLGRRKVPEADRPVGRSARPERVERLDDFAGEAAAAVAGVIEDDELAARPRVVQRPGCLQRA
jgi:hypothetical protein